MLKEIKYNNFKNKFDKPLEKALKIINGTLYSGLTLFTLDLYREIFQNIDNIYSGFNKIVNNEYSFMFLTALSFIYGYRHIKIDYIDSNDSKQQRYLDLGGVIFYI